jgi:hypothetical protein
MSEQLAPEKHISHTPGPWEWSGNWLVAKGKPWVLWYTTADDGLHGSQEDKRLIAVAPELLAALEELLAAHLETFPQFEAGKEAQDAWSDRRAAARNSASFIIAKAKCVA